MIETGKKTIPFMLVLMVILGQAIPAAPNETPPDYLFAIQQELARLGFSPCCNTATLSCTSPTPISSDADSLDLTVRYSKATDTIYIGFERFLVLDSKLDPAMAANLLGLNHQMVSAKFSWDEETRSITLSTSINTDSNFDRRAFRSQITGLKQIAKKTRPLLNPTSKATTEPPTSKNQEDSNPEDSQKSPDTVHEPT